MSGICALDQSDTDAEGRSSLYLPSLSSYLRLTAYLAAALTSHDLAPYGCERLAGCSRSVVGLRTMFTRNLARIRSADSGFALGVGLHCDVARCAGQTSFVQIMRHRPQTRVSFFPRFSELA